MHGSLKSEEYVRVTRQQSPVCSGLIYINFENISLVPNPSELPNSLFTPRPITIKIAIKITILAPTPPSDIVCLFQAHARAPHNRIDCDWLSVFLLFISLKKIILHMIPMISFVCAFIVIAVV